MAGITSIKISSDPGQQASKACTEWLTVDTPKEFQDGLSQRNQTHFVQAAGTFLTVPPFSEKVDWNASTHTAELILEGEYNDDDISDTSKQFVKYMKRKT